MSIKEEVNKSFGDDIVLSANSVLDTKVINIETIKVERQNTEV